MQARAKSVGIFKVNGYCQTVFTNTEKCHQAKFSTAIMAGQHNVLAQEVFLEVNGCNAGRCSACDVIILS